MRLVGFYIFFRASYETRLAPADAIRQFACHVEPRRWNRAYRFFGYQDIPPLRYEGRIWDGGFKIQRILDYPNSLAPVLLGAFSAAGDGTRITVRMRLPIVVFILQCCFSLGCAVNGFIYPPMNFAANWISFGLALAPWVMAAVHFPREVKKDAQRLKEIFCDSGAQGPAES